MTDQVIFGRKFYWLAIFGSKFYSLAIFDPKFYWLATVVPTKSDSDVICCLQLLSI